MKFVFVGRESFNRGNEIYSVFFFACVCVFKQVIVHDTNKELLYFRGKTHFFSPHFNIFKWQNVAQNAQM